MKIEYSDSVYTDVIKEAFANAGSWGQEVAGGIKWSEFDYQVFEHAGIPIGDDFTLHIVPGPGTGTHRTPSRSHLLVDMLSKMKLSLACADFAMPAGNPRVGKESRVTVDGLMFYVANRSSSDYQDALPVLVGAATSWTFLGIIYDTDSISSSDLASENVLRQSVGFVFSVYSGDSYMVALRVRQSAGSRS